MNNHDENKRLMNIMESYSMGPEVMPGAMDNEETENVTYSKTKKQGDATVTISANAKSMQELHDVLRLAGITLPAEHPAMQEPEGDDEETSVDDEEAGTAVIVHPDAEEEPESPCGGMSNDDPSYTTDKEKIIDRLRDTLKAKLIR